MAWKHKVLVYRLLSPVHLGYRKTGNLMQTRPYVLWRVWGSAFTVALVRGLSSPSDQAYSRVGKMLEDMFRFGYGWPAVLKEGKHNVSSLEDLEMGFDLWKEDREAFEYRFLNARAGTALEPDGTAREGSLHHVEYIAPFARDTGQPVFLVLDLWVRTPLEACQEREDIQKVLKAWKDHTRVLQIGGERGYGWGRLERVLWEDCESGKTVVGSLACVEQNGEVRVKLSKGAVLPFHVKAEEVIPVAGPVEVLAGYRFRGGRSLISSPPVAFAPGSRVLQDLEGILDPVNGVRMES
jgi:hypothetical protein